MFRSVLRRAATQSKLLRRTMSSSSARQRWGGFGAALNNDATTVQQLPVTKMTTLTTARAAHTHAGYIEGCCANDAAASIREALPENWTPQLGMILGSGMGGVADAIETEVRKVAFVFCVLMICFVACNCCVLMLGVWHVHAPSLCRTQPTTYSSVCYCLRPLSRTTTSPISPSRPCRVTTAG